MTGLVSHGPAGPGRAGVARVLTRVHRVLGLDRAIGWSLVTPAWTALSGPFVVAVIGAELSPEQQGFYFAFGSVLAMRAFFELGVTVPIQQVVSHERAFLTLGHDGTLTGSPQHKSRLRGLVAHSVRYYRWTALALWLFLVTAGSVFLGSGRTHGVQWLLPWLVTATMGSLTLLLSLYAAVIEAYGEVELVARGRALTAIVGTVVSVGLLIGGAGLWAPALGAACTALWQWLTLRRRTRVLVLDLRQAAAHPVSWRAEVWSFQWRAGVSAASGYVTLQAFVPILFYFRGPAAAGRMGLTLLVLNAVVGAAMTWLLTKKAAFAMSVARREYDALGTAFAAARRRSLSVSAVGFTTVAVGVAVLHELGSPYAGRFLDLPSLTLMCLGMFLTHIQWTQSAYLRAHKVEALMSVRVWCAALTAAAAGVCVPRFGALGSAASFVVIMATVSLVGGTRTYRRRRALWLAGSRA